MTMAKLNWTILFVVLMLSIEFSPAQSGVNIVSASSSETEKISTKQCKDLRLGKILNLPEPKYPDEARAAKVGGVVEVTVRIGESGNVLEVEKISGNPIFHGASAEAAKKAKFVPTLCDGKRAIVSGLIVFNFYPFPSSRTYILAEKIEDFSDISKDSQYYSAIFQLTENYKIAYGFSDRKFHAEAILTRGDFAHFLRLTLEMLTEKAKTNDSVIKFFTAYNPQQIRSIVKIKDLKSKEPFYDSVLILLQNFNIVLVNKNSEFRGGAPVTQNELIEIWTNVFGNDAVPVNFERTENFEKNLSRGEFAVFLNESLEILIYKISP